MYIWVSMYVYTYVYVCMCVYTYIYIYIYMYLFSAESRCRPPAPPLFRPAAGARLPQQHGREPAYYLSLLSSISIMYYLLSYISSIIYYLSIYHYSLRCRSCYLSLLLV